jgi:hypothetical protein
LKKLDAQAKDVICNHLSKGKFIRRHTLKTSKEIWDRLEKVNADVSTQKESRIDTFLNSFNHFKRIDNECVQDNFDRLCHISGELQGLGAQDVSDHAIVKKLLHFLDNSLDTSVMMIKERTDYKSLNPASVIEKLNTHELQEK